MQDGQFAGARYGSPLVAASTIAFYAAPDDYLALRGTRTLAVRLEQHYRSGLEMARWLERGFAAFNAP
jgi:cystathionine beta-lyase/cystathionine gamma-synthase